MDNLVKFYAIHIYNETQYNEITQLLYSYGFRGQQEITQIILLSLIYIGYFLKFQIKLLFIHLRILYLQKLIPNIS